MPKTQEQCAKIREETRKKILSGSLSYFAYNGYGNSTVGDLAKYLGIAQGAIYRYFSSKAELFQVLIEEVVNGNNDHLANIFESESSPEEKIKKLTKVVLDGIFYDEKTREGFILNMRMKLESGSVNCYSSEYGKKPDDFLKKTIIEGQKKGSVVDGMPSVLSDFYWHSVHGIAVDFILRKNLNYEEHYRILTRILLKDK